MPRISVRVVVSSLIAALVFCPVGRTVVADDSAPTTFQRAISSWMGVVALLADDGDGEPQAASEHECKGENCEHCEAAHGGDKPHGCACEGKGGEHCKRGDSGMKVAEMGGGWHEPGSPGPGTPSMRMRPMGSPMHGMPVMGLRPDASAKHAEIVERLSRIERKLDAAPRRGNPWSPRPEAAAMSQEAQARMRDMMQEGRRRMAEANEKMELARKRFQEMEERIKKLEAEVERLKAAK